MRRREVQVDRSQVVTHNTYYEDADFVLVVADKTRLSTFERLATYVEEARQAF